MNDMVEAGLFKPEKPDRKVAWTTDDEIEFIKQIGSALWPEKLPRPKELRKSVLIGKYLEAIQKRTEWGDMDKEKVIGYAQRRMAYEAQVEKEGDMKWHP